MKNLELTNKIQPPVERKLLLLGLFIGIIASGLSTWLEVLIKSAPIYKTIAFPSITLVLIILFIITLLNRNLTIVAHILLISSGLLLGSYLIFASISRNNLSLIAEMGKFSPWFFSLYTLIFWVYGINLGKKIAALYYFLVLAITLSFHLPFLLKGERLEETRVLLSFYLSNAVLILVLANFKKRFDNQSEVAAKMRLAAHTDQLTDLGNRLYIQKVFLEEIERAERYGQGFSVAIIDIDHFKSINDNYGHNIGDEVIKHVALFLKTEIRKVDKSSRWGGEEFLVIFPELDLLRASSTCSRIQGFIRSHKFETMPNKVITVSIGVTTWRNGDAIENLVRRADEALYRAKREGRDRVVAH